MCNWVKKSDTEKRGNCPAFISPVLLIPKAAISNKTKAGLLTYSTFSRPSHRASGGQWQNR